MKSFIAVALCFLAASASAQTTVANGTSNSSPASGSSPGPHVGKSSDPDEAIICADNDLSKVCQAKGEADKTCKDLATKVNGTEPTCVDVGVCSIKSAAGDPSNTSAASEATPTGSTTGATSAGTTAATSAGTTAAGGNATTAATGDQKTILIGNKAEVPNSTLLRKCENGVFIHTANSAAPGAPAPAGGSSAGTTQSG